MHLNLLISCFFFLFPEAHKTKPSFGVGRKGKFCCVLTGIFQLSFQGSFFPHYSSQKIRNAAVEMNCIRQLKEICDSKPTWKTHYFYMHIYKTFIKLVGSKTFVFPQVTEIARLPKAIQCWAGEVCRWPQQQEQLLEHPTTAAPTGAIPSWGEVRLARELQAIRGN